MNRSHRLPLRVGDIVDERGNRLNPDRDGIHRRGLLIFDPERPTARPREPAPTIDPVTASTEAPIAGEPRGESQGGSARGSDGEGEASPDDDDPTAAAGPPCYGLPAIPTVEETALATRRAEDGRALQHVAVVLDSGVHRRYYVPLGSDGEP